MLRPSFVYYIVAVNSLITAVFFIPSRYFRKCKLFALHILCTKIKSDIKWTHVIDNIYHYLPITEDQAPLSRELYATYTPAEPNYDQIRQDGATEA